MTVKGFKFSGIAAGIKPEGKKDLALISGDGTLTVAGVFTTCKVEAAPVTLDKERVKSGQTRAVIVNSGNANACTGDEGLADAKEMARLTAESLGTGEEDVLVSSTGVIGQRLPMERFSEGIPSLVAALDSDGLKDAVEAIMTTDAFPKSASVTRELGGKSVTVTGIAKGAGMIAPNMATMLAYLMTDADVEPKVLQHALKVTVDESFNCITVDGDMSTNDTLLALASGASGVKIDEGTHEHLVFLKMLKEVAVDLAKMIASDGEGATKLVEITVRGAETDSEAKRAALKIANSPLVKTAFYGEDANWGRIAAAVGGAGITLDEKRLDIWFDDVKIVEGGLFTGEKAEAEATEAMKKKEVRLTVELNLGTCDATIWTCDLTHDYIRINAEYRS